jgi:ubiquitin-protein ligase
MKSFARLNKEYGDLVENPIGCVEISYVGEEISKWNCKVQGPEDTPYYGGFFNVEMDFSDNYPFKAPKVLFKTKIYHPNVKTDTGEICTQAIEKSWVPTQNARYVIESIVSLMASPRAEDPLEQEIADMFINNHDGFVTEAAKYTAEFAGE